MTKAANPDVRERSGGAVVVVLLVLVFFGLPIVYCLGLGPAIWLVNKRGVDPTFFATIYAPLEWLHKNVDFIRPLLDWYVKLWQ